VEKFYIKMESGKVEGWNEFLNKKVLIIYDDGGNHPVKKTGWILEIGSTHLILNEGTKTQGLNLQRIIRVEEAKE
jgi:hypothetical protein